MKKAIYFYGGGYDCLSNFAAYQVTYNNQRWMTAEHAYQAAKFDQEEVREEIRSAPSAFAAKMIGQKYRDQVRSDWHDVNVEIMKGILQAKLSAHEHIQEKLSASGDRKLVEGTNDTFWGRGPDGNGRNMLGQFWMQLREEV